MRVGSSFVRRAVAALAAGAMVAVPVVAVSAPVANAAPKQICSVKVNKKTGVAEWSNKTKKVYAQLGLGTSYTTDCQASGIGAKAVAKGAGASAIAVSDGAKKSKAIAKATSKTGLTVTANATAANGKKAVAISFYGDVTVTAS